MKEKKYIAYYQTASGTSNIFFGSNFAKMKKDIRIIAIGACPIGQSVSYSISDRVGKILYQKSYQK